MSVQFSFEAVYTP